MTEEHPLNKHLWDIANLGAIVLFVAALFTFARNDNLYAISATYFLIIIAYELIYISMLIRRAIAKYEQAQNSQKPSK